MADILDSLNKKQINEFSKDFLELVRVAAGMNVLYTKQMEKPLHYMKKYKALIESFNKKYSGIQIKVSKSLEELNFNVFLKEKSVKDVFNNVASKIAGLKTIGLKGFDEASLEDSDKFSKAIAGVDKELYLSYYYPETGSDKVYLKFKQNMIQIIFDFDLLLDEKSAEFKLCAYYGTKENIDHEIDIYNEAASFGFAQFSKRKQWQEYYDKFDPKMLE